MAQLYPGKESVHSQQQAIWLYPASVAVSVALFATVSLDEQRVRQEAWSKEVCHAIPVEAVLSAICDSMYALTGLSAQDYALITRMTILIAAVCSGYCTVTGSIFHSEVLPRCTPDQPIALILCCLSRIGRVSQQAMLALQATAVHRLKP